MAKKRKIRRKPKAVRKTDQIRVLVSPTEKQRLANAAFTQGLSAGAWLRLMGLREAARLQREGVVLPQAD